MPVAKLTLEVEIAHAQSLKDRRQVVRSIKDTLRHGFNVSVAELDEAPVWNRATLGVASVSRSLDHLQKQLTQAERAARRAAVRYGSEIIDAWVDLLPDDSPDVPDLPDQSPEPHLHPQPSLPPQPDSDKVNPQDFDHA